MAVNHLLRECLTCALQAPRFAFIAPYLKQAKDIAWDYVKRFAGVIPGASFNESELRVDLPGDRRIRLYGADNPDSIQGIYLDGVVMDEYQLTTPRLFTQIIRPMLADRKGWVIFSGKPLGHNHFFDLYRKMQADDSRLVRLYRASETQILSAEELQDMRVGPPGMSEDEYQQELECSWEAAVQGAYYARQMEAIRQQGRIRTVPWQPAIPVNTYWDLGISDYTSIIFAQPAGREIHVIDYLQANGHELAYYAAEIQRKPYIYGEHVLPHDGGALELGTGKTIADQLRGLLRGAGVAGGLDRIRVRVLPPGDVTPGIEASRRLLSRCWFDEAKCRQLIDALSLYRQGWDEKRQMFKDKPEHDDYSHGADAFRYMAVGMRDSAIGPPPLVVKRTFDVLDHGRPELAQRRRPFTVRTQ